MTTPDQAQQHSIVVGTAGHIDHGKTVLVRALTGIDTDRLPEENAAASRSIWASPGVILSPLRGGGLRSTSSMFPGISSLSATCWPGRVASIW